MLTVRPATMDDAEILFEWRNDPMTRAMSKNSDQVQWEDHVKWVSDRLSRAHPKFHIAELDGRPVGTFRINGDEISYTIAPDHRRQGIGTEMLIEARKMFGPLRAEIFEKNSASLKIAKRAGMMVTILTS